jgi:hypothetical protein
MGEANVYFGRSFDLGRVTVVLGLDRGFPPDAIELALPGPAQARELVSQRHPVAMQLLAQRRSRFLDTFGPAIADEIGRCEDAIVLGLARFGARHGSWGDDYHHYHNEEHALEILGGRLERVIQCVGLDSLPLGDWMALSLFSVCHDLRQRETADYAFPIGNNEAASVMETLRILDDCGYSRETDRSLYLKLELCIAGSTFDARPAPFNPAEVVATGGALAPKLGTELDHACPGWRADADIVAAQQLALIASDLDTANVAEPIPQLGESALRLCREREKLAGRELHDQISAEPCLRFLSNGQERYFFDLHRFCSAVGERTFAAAKANNAPQVRALADRLRRQFGNSGERAGNGAEVLAGFEALLASG